jgi:hypothetical protein
MIAEFWGSIKTALLDQFKEYPLFTCGFFAYNA